MRTAILFLILIFLIDMVFGLGFRFYRILYFDIILHFLGGFFVAMFFYDYLKEYMNPVKGQKINPFDRLRVDTEQSRSIKKILIITGATVFIGVIWEFSEYIATALLSDYLYNNYRIICCMGNLSDTINDLAMDIIGAVIFTFFTLKSEYKSIINK